jgi:hypothetical protein
MSIHRSILSAAVIFVVIVNARAASAQEPLTLATVTKMKCTFPIMWMGDWTKPGDAQGKSDKSDLTVTYDAIDTQDGTAQVSGFTGNFYITVRLVANVALHLLHTDAAGPVYMTTVFNKPAHPGTFKAVHTRHEFTEVSLPGFTSRPEQYVGECELLK